MNRKIFIVEDHEIVREGYMLFFELDPGLAVCGTADTAEEALTAIPAAAPDLILVDISLPGMSGIEFVRRLRDDGHTTPVLMVTGHDSERYRAEAAEAGAQGLVMKHESPSALTAAVHRLLAV